MSLFAMQRMVELPVGLFAFPKSELFSNDITAGYAGVTVLNICPHLLIDLLKLDH